MALVRTTGRRVALVACLLTLCGAATAIAISPGIPQAGATTGADSDVVWLCRPGMAHDPCLSDLTTTVEATGRPDTAGPAG
jgi:hypothetical protein